MFLPFSCGRRPAKRRLKAGSIRAQGLREWLEANTSNTGSDPPGLAPGNESGASGFRATSHCHTEISLPLKKAFEEFHPSGMLGFCTVQ